MFLCCFFFFFLQSHLWQLPFLSFLFHRQRWKCCLQQTGCLKDEPLKPVSTSRHMFLSVRIKQRFKQVESHFQFWISLHSFFSSTTASSSWLQSAHRAGVLHCLIEPDILIGDAYPQMCFQHIQKWQNGTHTDNKHAGGFSWEKWGGTMNIRYSVRLNIQHHDSAGGEKEISAAELNNPARPIKLLTAEDRWLHQGLRVGCVGTGVPVTKHFLNLSGGMNKSEFANNFNFHLCWLFQTFKKKKECWLFVLLLTSLLRFYCFTSSLVIQK